MIPLAMSVKDVADALAVSERTVWRLAAVGEIPQPMSIGRLKRWRRSTLEAWLARQESEATRQHRLPAKIS